MLDNSPQTRRIFLFLLILFALKVVHSISRQPFLLDIIIQLVQPSPRRHSSLISPLLFHFHHPPSPVVFLYSHHMPIPLNLLSWTFFAIFSSLATTLIHRSILLGPPISCPVPPSMPLYLPRSTVPVLLLSCAYLHVHCHVAQHSRQSVPVLPTAMRHYVGDFRI